MRFALRMSVVLMAGMTFNLLSKDSHSYWFVMNAFLLLRPMYEDSNYRMRTRFLGTAAGCVIVALILPFCNTMSSHLILAGIMVTCMYTATPGTIIHALFVTCFALSMTTLAIGETMAVFPSYGLYRFCSSFRTGHKQIFLSHKSGKSGAL